MALRALVGALVVGLAWFVRSRSRKPAVGPPELPLSVLKALAAEPKLTGPQAAMIVRRLQALKPSEVELVRMKSLFFRLSEAGGAAPRCWTSRRSTPVG